MKYSETKTILYNSEELSRIPDRWEESIPFVCVYNNQEMDAFLYWSSNNKYLEIKQMIGVDRFTGKITLFDSIKLKETFNLTSLRFPSVIISNYDDYVSDKERYVTIYEQLSESKAYYSQYGNEAYSLFKRIVGNDLFEKVFSSLAYKYLKDLSAK